MKKLKFPIIFHKNHKIFKIEHSCDFGQIIRSESVPNRSERSEWRSESVPNRSERSEWGRLFASGRPTSVFFTNNQFIDIKSCFFVFLLFFYVFHRFFCFFMFLLFSYVLLCFFTFHMILLFFYVLLCFFKLSHDFIDFLCFASFFLIFS